jgi:hypothetical protein
MVNWHTIYRKGRNTFRTLGKGLGATGRVLTKGADVASRVLSQFVQAEPALAANPYVAGALTATKLASIAGHAATGVSQSNSIESAGASLRDAYGQYKNVTRPSAPGGEMLSTAANEM